MYTALPCKDTSRWSIVPWCPSSAWAP